jgi:hypothetical protein
LFIVFLTQLITDAEKKVFLIVDNLSVPVSQEVDQWLADKKDRAVHVAEVRPRT